MHHKRHGDADNLSYHLSYCSTIKITCPLIADHNNYAIYSCWEPRLNWLWVLVNLTSHCFRSSVLWTLYSSENTMVITHWGWVESFTMQSTSTYLQQEQDRVVCLADLLNMVSTMLTSFSFEACTTSSTQSLHKGLPSEFPLEGIYKSSLLCPSYHRPPCSLDFQSRLNILMGNCHPFLGAYSRQT